MPLDPFWEKRSWRWGWLLFLFLLAQAAWCVRFSEARAVYGSPVQGELAARRAD